MVNTGGLCWSTVGQHPHCWSTLTGEQLREISSLPEWSQAAFKGMKSLNRIQSRICETALFSAENMLICAPTGAGKTNCAMLTILHQMGMHRHPDGSFDLSKFKIIYIAPMKARNQYIWNTAVLHALMVSQPLMPSPFACRRWLRRWSATLASAWSLTACRSGS